MCACVCVCVCVCVPAYISCVCLLAVGLADALSKLLLGARHPGCNDGGGVGMNCSRAGVISTQPVDKAEDDLGQ